MKKLLHIGVNAGTESLPKYFREATEYQEFKLDYQLGHNIDKLGYVPDIVFLQIQNDKIHNETVNNFIGQRIRKLRDSGAFVINWTGDKRNGVPSWMKSFAGNVSLTAFSNDEDVSLCQQSGIKSAFLQQGIDTNIYRPDGEAKNMPEIVFFANNYGNQFPLGRERKVVAESLKTHFGNRFGLYGNGWSHSDGNLNISQHEESKAYRGAKIAISISHFNSDRYFSDRLGRALCSGVFVLSHNYTGIDKDFQKGVHLDIFENTQELINKCNHYLSKDNERKAIAKAGNEHAMKELSYQKMVQEIIKLAE